MDILATIRSGCASSEVVHALKKRCREPVNMNGVLATKVWGIPSVEEQKNRGLIDCQTWLVLFPFPASPVAAKEAVACCIPPECTCYVLHAVLFSHLLGVLRCTSRPLFLERRGDHHNLINHMAQLFTHREDVDALNRDELLALAGEAVRFQAQDTGHVDALKTSCPVSALPCPELAPPGYIALANILQKKMPFTDTSSFRYKDHRSKIACFLFPATTY